MDINLSKLGDGEMPGVLQSKGSQRGGRDWATQQEEEKINESKKWFFEKINKIDKPSSGLTKNKGENSNKIRNERGDNIIYTIEIQKNHKNYYEELYTKMGLPNGSVVKNPPVTWEPQETRVQSLGQEDPLEKGMATHSSVLAWRIPMNRGAQWATIHGVMKSRKWPKQLSTHTPKHWTT